MSKNLVHVHVASYVITIGSRVAFGCRQVGTQDGVVEDVQIRWHAMVPFVVVQHLDTSGCSVSSYLYCICELPVQFKVPILPEQICELLSCEPLEVYFSQRMLGLISGCSPLLNHHIYWEQSQWTKQITKMKSIEYTFNVLLRYHSFAHPPQHYIIKTKCNYSTVQINNSWRNSAKFLILGNTFSDLKQTHTFMALHCHFLLYDCPCK